MIFSYQSHGSHCHRITRDFSHRGSLRMESMFYDEKRDPTKEDYLSHRGITFAVSFRAAETENNDDARKCVKILKILAKS